MDIYCVASNEKEKVTNWKYGLCLWWQVTGEMLGQIGFANEIKQRNKQKMAERCLRSNQEPGLDSDQCACNKYFTDLSSCLEI